jgi:hypothetical protein
MKFCRVGHFPSLTRTVTVKMFLTVTLKSVPVWYAQTLLTEYKQFSSQFPHGENYRTMKNF